MTEAQNITKYKTNLFKSVAIYTKSTNVSCGSYLKAKKNHAHVVIFLHPAMRYKVVLTVF